MPLLGLVVDVCLHLRAGKETEKGAVGGIGRGYIEASKAAIIETWRAAVADPSPAPSHVRVRRGDARFHVVQLYPIG